MEVNEQFMQICQNIKEYEEELNNTEVNEENANKIYWLKSRIEKLESIKWEVK